MYATWDPTFPHELGDYGSLDRESGQFHAEGNIFDGEFFEKHEKMLGELRDPIEQILNNHWLFRLI